MENVRIHELPREHVAGTRLAWEIARALRARGGWVLTGTSVSRTWRIRIGGRRWSANLYTSFFFDGNRERPPGVVHAIHVETNPAPDGELEASDYVRELRARVGAGYTVRTPSAGKLELVRVVRNHTNPRVILDDLSRLAGILGGTRERPARPARRARALDARLWIVVDALLRDGRWTIEAPSMWFEPVVRPPLHLLGSLQPIPRASTKDAFLHAMLTVDAPPRYRRMHRLFAAMKSRALARGYVDKDPRDGAVLVRVQPLSIRRATSEADFLESELRALSPR